ncbi:hypothetical protein CC86DRAFT_192264 [Ophiobolus disseminans]|uniref:Mediator complex subunit 27 n=1 Tax=Ophiobolus disseminans TaxID=1469910 RepID=A0A6A7A5C7_9PLEO|nr:hypothetical protein CC86DRAFT_192264 [Ophiobolus disseminans]
MAAPDVAPQPGTEWDEAQCTAALALLEHLQAQIDDLRLALPRVIEPFHQPPNPRMFKLYVQGVVGSQNGIKTLREEWKSSETQTMFEHTKKSLTANPDLSASTSIPSHGWTERERKERESRKNKHDESSDEVTLTNEEVTRLISEVQKAWPNLHVDTRDDNHIISVQFVHESVKLKFRVTIERDANGRHTLNGKCLGTTEPFLTITRCIASRPQASDLKYLLNMVAAYTNVKSKECAKCEKIFDNTMSTPMARRSRQIVAADGTTETRWEAFHESCLS